MIDWQARCLAAEDALRRARSKLQVTEARRKVLAVLGDLAPGETVETAAVAAELGLKRDTALAALQKLAEAGFVDRSGQAGCNGRPVRWKLAHLVVVGGDD